MILFFVVVYAYENILTPKFMVYMHMYSCLIALSLAKRFYTRMSNTKVSPWSSVKETLSFFGFVESPSAGSDVFLFSFTFQLRVYKGVHEPPKAAKECVTPVPCKYKFVP